MIGDGPRGPPREQITCHRETTEANADHAGGCQTIVIDEEKPLNHLLHAAAVYHCNLKVREAVLALIS